MPILSRLLHQKGFRRWPFEPVPRVDKDAARPQTELVDGASTVATEQRARVEADHLENLSVVTVVIAKDSLKSSCPLVSSGAQLTVQ